MCLELKEALRFKGGGSRVWRLGFEVLSFAV